MFYLFKVVFLVTLASLAVAWTGDATWYTPAGGIGACGAPSKTSDLVVALGPRHYLGGKNCWRHISVRYGNKWVDATVVDLCPSCGDHAIDLSKGAFKKLASASVGRMQVEWHYQ